MRAEFDHLVIRDDFVADLAGSTSHRLLEFQPQVTLITKGQLELHLTVPGPDVWTSLLTGMTVIRQSGYAPIAVHVLEIQSRQPPTSRHRQRLKLGEAPQANGNRHMRGKGDLDSVYSSSGRSRLLSQQFAGAGRYSPSGIPV